MILGNRPSDRESETQIRIELPLTLRIGRPQLREKCRRQSARTLFKGELHRSILSIATPSDQEYGCAGRAPVCDIHQQVAQGLHQLLPVSVELETTR